MLTYLDVQFESGMLAYSFAFGRKGNALWMGLVQPLWYMLTTWLCGRSREWR
jgi:hypothetical protein